MTAIDVVRDLDDISISRTMGTEYHYQATAETTQHDVFRCACGYASGVAVTASGMGAGEIGDAWEAGNAAKREAAASEALGRAKESAEYEARTLIAFARCPKCGQRNKEAIRARRGNSVRTLTVLFVFLFGIPAALYALDMTMLSIGIGVFSLMLYPIIFGAWLFNWLGNYRNADKMVRFNGIAPPPPGPAKLPLPG